MMFICLVVASMGNGEWRYVKVPALEQGLQVIAVLEQCLLPYASSYHHIYIASELIPLHDIEQWITNWENKNLNEHLAFMNNYTKCFRLKWRKIVGSKQKGEHQISSQLELASEEDKLLEVAQRHTAGRLLHLYELQRCLQHHGIQLTLEKLMTCIVKWSFTEKTELLAGIAVKQVVMKRRYCRRCANSTLMHSNHRCYSCGNKCYYCPQCVALGKVKTCTLLIRFKHSGEFEVDSLKSISLVEPSSLVAPYGLSNAQSEAVMTLVHAIQRHYGKQRYTLSEWIQSRRRLSYILWAVTGAGKTEMIFPLIHLFQLFNLKVLIAIPRRDVVQELLPRLSRAFPESKVVGLYGGSEQTWEVAHIYVATTHQLIRFDAYFDLVILDEMDAFPYYHNVTLMRTLQRVQKSSSCFIQLTATVPEAEKLKMRLGWQRYVQVPVRYHQKPLPVPTFIPLPPLATIVHNNVVPTQLINIVKLAVARGAVMFMFVQRKRYLPLLCKLLEEVLPQLVISYTSAEDRAREEKIASFRRREINVLLTTSILERGVTIPKSDICIIDVHHRAFSRTAIVQMAGRAGRSSDDPKGNVFLCGQHKTAATRRAIREIKAMNRLAKSKGYIKEEDGQ